MTATAVAPRPTAAPAAAPPTRVARLRRPLAACALLLVIYVALSYTNDPRAFLSTDVGGKVATLRTMDATGSLKPVLPYWAQAVDPQGTYQPLPLTARVDGQWVNVTTLPMLYAAYPLYELGGLRAILLLPMIGGVLSALGARALARRLGARGDLAFWLVGLATPVVIYSLDFWEHALGLAAMVWGIVWLFDVADRRAGWRAALGAGALFGLAATMRTEALVYVVVTVGVVAWTTRRRGVRWLATLGAASVAGVAVPLAANQALEVLVLGTGFRAARASDAASAGGLHVASRVSDALTTTVGLNDYRGAMDWILGGIIVLGFALAARWLLAADQRSRRLGWAALAVGLLFLTLRMLDGLGFLPGLLIASPLAIVGLVVANRRPEYRRPVAVALLALPIVWVFQYGGGAQPQWGGRYALCTGLLLAVVAAVALERMPWRRTVTVVALAAAVTGLGVAWLSQRTQVFAHVETVVSAERNPVVSVGIPHLFREGGAFYTPTRRWLTAENPGDLPGAAEVLARLHAPTFTLASLLHSQAPAALGPYARQPGTRLVPLFDGQHLYLTRYATAP